MAKWIQNFAEFTAPLYGLLHKGVRFESMWSSIHDESLEALRRCVETAPILIVLDYKNMVFLRTDASLLAIAAVVYQLVDKKNYQRAMAQRNSPTIRNPGQSYKRNSIR